jgi:hypothetical protein
MEPLTTLAVAAFGVMFWLFCLLPNWINADAEALDPLEVEQTERR